MSIDGKTDFIGPSRAGYMAGMQNGLTATDLNDAIVRANLKSIYGDRIQLPDNERLIIGGDFKIEQPSPPAIQVSRPGHAGWIAFATLLATIVLMLATAVGVWWFLSQRVPSHAVPPAPTVPTKEDFDVGFFVP